MSTITEPRAAGRLLPTFLLLLSLVVGGGFIVSCNAEAKDGDDAAKPAAAAGDTSGDPGDVMARVGGDEITRAQVEEAADEQLGQIDKQLEQCQVEAKQKRHETLELQTRQMVRERLLGAEAESRGMSQDELLQAEVQSRAAEVTDADVDAFYEQNKNRINQPKEVLEDQIRQYLRQQRESEAYESFISGLEDQAKVAYEIGPYRSEIDIAGEPSTGPENAPVTIVEFSDFQCPFCSRVVPTLEKVKQDYGDRVRLVFKQFPLAIHPNAQKAAEASLCADDQGKFWEMHDAMFGDQENLGVDGLEAKAESLGLDMAAFRQCLSSGQYASAVKDDMDQGSAVGVSGTPAMFVNGRLVSGAVPYEEIASVVDDELKRAGR